jgi:Family of unknown function (DUF6266)
MGVIKRGILGGFSGSVGNVVGSSWKGIATMKAKPLSVANPNTAGQIEQRSKLRNIVAFAKLILVGIIKPLNDRFASGQSGYNLFVQRNISLFENELPSPAGDLVLSRGGVTPMDITNFTANAATNQVTLTWANNTGDGNALATDIGVGVVINNTTNEVFPWEFIGARPDAPASLNLGNITAGDNIDLYVSMKREDGTQVSNTVYRNVVA